MSYALITGASSGIGFALAEVMASKGHDLLLVARSEQKLTALASRLEKQFTISAIVMPLDLSEQGAGQKLNAFILKNNLDVEYLVNNAGVGDFGFFAESEVERQLQMVDLNVRSLTEVSHYIVPALVKRGGGKVLNVASTAAFQPGPYMAVYYATKAYVLSFSQALANELTGKGVTVTALCPGPTTSGFQDVANMNKSGLVKLFPMPTSKQVAEYGYRTMMSGKRVAIHGFSNWLMAQSSRFTPRRLTTAIVRLINKPS